MSWSSSPPRANRTPPANPPPPIPDEAKVCRAVGLALQTNTASKVKSCKGIPGVRNQHPSPVYTQESAIAASMSVAKHKHLAGQGNAGEYIDARLDSISYSSHADHFVFTCRLELRSPRPDPL